jgi:hypothetical protein
VSELRDVILPLVLEGVGIAILTDSWAGLARQAGALVFDLEPVTHLQLALASRAGTLTPAARKFLELAIPDRTNL